MKNIVKISILMPVYNEEKYILEAVSSISSYEYPDFIDVELVVVDDFSTDNTFQLLTSVCNDINININIKVKSNVIKGKNSAFNVAYLNSTGDYICLMGGDDLIDPGTLVLRANAIFSKQSSYDDLIYSCCKIKTFSNFKKYDSIIIPKAKGLGSSSGGAIMFTRALIDKILPLPNNLPNEDSWIAHYLKFFPEERVDISEVGLYYRIHENNSHKRGLSYEDYKDQMWSRKKSILFFYERYGDRLEPDNERLLVLDMYKSTAVYSNQTLPILMSKKISFKDKLKLLADASSFFYRAKVFLYRYVVGR